MTDHEVLCVLHAHVASSTAHFRAARVAASHDPCETPQKKKRLHFVLPQPSAPLLHQASHSADVATLRAGRMRLTPPLLLQADAQDDSLKPPVQLPAEQTVPLVRVWPSVQTHSCGYGQPEDVTKSRDAGFDEHVVKPVNVARIDSIIRNEETRCDRRSP